METHAHAAGPAITFALALLAGVLAQGAARHLRLPGIVVLLGVGVALGPEGLGLVNPAELGDALSAIVGFAVAIILFEGGLNLEIARLRRQGRAVQRLLTLGSLVTLLGGMLAARFLLGWDWRLSVLFGSLVIVTGPTVVTPLLRRVKVKTRVQTVLEAEGVLIDAVGAITAVVILEVALRPGAMETAAGAGGFALRFLVGVPAGAAVGLLAALALRVRYLVPSGMENIFALALVVAAFQVGDSFLSEMGIVVATVAGLVVGNMKTRVTRELAEFKEQLTVMLIGLLFVLLAATVSLDEVIGLGWPGAAVVAVLMWVVRPLGVALSTLGTDLTWKDRAFISWVAPRGIVAAAVASLFAQSLDAAGIAGGSQLVALVFTVIATTVTLQGLTMGPVASLLGVRRPGNAGFVILGANGLGVALAEAMRSAGQEAVLVESNSDRANRARERGIPVVYGNGLEERVMLRTQPDTRIGALAVTPNEEANLLFARRMHHELDCPQAWIAIDRVGGHLKPELVEEADLGLLFAMPRDIDIWAHWLERGRAKVERWRRTDVPEATDQELVSEVPANPVKPNQPARQPFLPLVHIRKARVQPWHAKIDVRAGDRLYLAIDSRSREQAESFLREWGWEPDPPEGFVAEDEPRGAA